MKHAALVALVALALAATCQAQSCTFYKPKNGTESKCWPSMTQLDAMAPPASNRTALETELYTKGKAFIECLNKAADNEEFEKCEDQEPPHDANKANATVFQVTLLTQMDTCELAKNATACASAKSEIRKNGAAGRTLASAAAALVALVMLLVL